MKKLLIIEKQTIIRQFLIDFLQKKRWQFFCVEEGNAALKLLEKEKFDLIFSDLKGIRTIKRSRYFPLKIPLVYLKERKQSKEEGVDAVLNKPFEEEDLEEIWPKIKGNKIFNHLVIAESPLMKKLLKRVEKIAKSHSNIFICGESGTGKEVIANMIHSLSKRSFFPFIRVNCAALPDTLVESEFFGHEKGAFTGAHTKRIGRFELANKGSLLLDEISEIPASLQVKLLRVIQEQEFERVGAAEPIPIDVRLISTSNRNMKEAVENQEFREDLYYRLNVIPVYLPPLRERKEDILPLAHLFLEENCQKNQLSLKMFSPSAKAKLVTYHWPGNIRQLRNAIEYGVAIADFDLIDVEHLFFDETKKLKKEKQTLGMSLKEMEKHHILMTLKAYGGQRKKTASELGISVRTLRNKLESYSISSKASKDLK